MTVPTPTRCLVVAVAAVVLLRSGPAAAQLYCDDPPAATVLTGEPLALSALESEGHPTGFAWYVTPPGGSLPANPTSTASGHVLTPDAPGLWSVGLEVSYAHQAIGGGLWSSEACVTIEASRVMAAIGLSASRVTTDESLELSGAASQWAEGVEPEVEWRVDGVAFTACNGGPPPASPTDLVCTVPGGWMAPGWHTAALNLSDPSSGQNSLASADFEVIEVVPLGVDFTWTPFHPDPDQLVRFMAELVPDIPEEDLTLVVWNLGDGTVETFTECPLFYGSCLLMPHRFTADAWYQVSLTVHTAEESASRSHDVEVGDPIDPPVAAFAVSPASPALLQLATMSFTGSCEGSCTWSWDFGDGVHSTLSSPTHAWAIPATYTVGLTVTNESGVDSTELDVTVDNCWSPASPTQSGTCYGGPVTLTAAAGSAWSWSTGATTQVIPATLSGSYWVNVRSGAACWGHADAMVVLDNCGDPGGDVNLDGALDAADPAALVPELTDGDGDAVVGAGGGDLTAPGGDVTRDGRLRIDDLAAVVAAIFQ